MTRREEIEQAAMQVGGVHPDWDALECFRVGYKEGAKWADKTMVEKTISWFYKNAHKGKYWDKDGCLLITFIMNDYRQAMEE